MTLSSISRHHFYCFRRPHSLDRSDSCSVCRRCQSPVEHVNDDDDDVAIKLPKPHKSLHGLQQTAFQRTPLGTHISDRFVNKTTTQNWEKEPHAFRNVGTFFFICAQNDNLAGTVSNEYIYFNVLWRFGDIFWCWLLRPPPPRYRRWHGNRTSQFVFVRFSLRSISLASWEQHKHMGRCGRHVRHKFLSSFLLSSFVLTTTAAVAAPQTHHSHFFFLNATWLRLVFSTN